MPKRTLLRGGTVIDGLGSAARHHTSLLTENNTIQAIGHEADALAAADPATEVVDVTGCTVIPGLVDMHSHLSYVPNPRGPLGINDTLSIEANTLEAVGNAWTYLRHGFTTLLDVGTRGSIASSVRDAVSQGLICGPRVVASGQVISSTGGLMNSYPSWVDVRLGNGASADGEVEIRREVRRQSIAGVDSIKLGVTGQLGTRARDWLLLSQGEIAVAVDEARRRRLSVGAHAYGPEAVAAAISGGVNIVHHAFAGLTEETIDLFARMGTFLVPTAMAFIDKPTPAGWPDASRQYYESNLAGYISGLQQILASDLKDQVAVGSDSGISNPTATTAKEILLFERLGLTSIEAIRAATHNAARALSLDDTIGSLEVGKQADVSVVSGDVCSSLDLLLQPENFLLVIKGGRVVVDGRPKRTQGWTA